MGAALGTYGVVYRQLTEVGSPPGDWLVSLTEFQFGTIFDYDVDVVRGNGYVAKKLTTGVTIASPTISTDGILEVRIIVRRNLPLWKDT
jgi:hypothetical protein